MPNTLERPGQRLHNASMPNILIRDVPSELHSRLLERAAAAGQSLQQYLVTQLSQLVDKPTMAEWVDMVEASLATNGESHKSETDEIIELIHEAREERIRHLLGDSDDGR